ncbi:glycoside hydrolase family 97 protein [Flavobacterium hibernum]|uniref:Retaining alpha-galactosidase n=1 Tax=Flavobacterium hibernum TaxID=37752 RepID=A0A0D0F585_9FLAO|nr:glycoside hydrolase family 97 protein [Flavobacterium hibernum]KIO53287.1 Retaining alpha-galactosidase [Flavobacterium hibernum]OXA87887.1 Retaining alpha-galactosidase [Flavobacterium hibernum]STO10475.1 Retaining alpha-galactosidase precursor [Flavobacterium hibernum]
MKKTLIIFYLLLVNFSFSQKKQDYILKSPDGKIEVKIEVSDKTSWTIFHEKDLILSPSEMSLTIDENIVLGKNPIVVNSKKESVDTSFETPFYKKKSVQDKYNQLVINFKNDFSIEYRVFNDGAAYRFITKKKKDITVKWEEVQLNFDRDYNTLMPYVRDLRNPKDPYISSFEAQYENKKISEFAKDTLAFLPFLIDFKNNKKAVFLEANLEDYPGLFVTNNNSKSGFESRFSKYPLQEKNGGFNNINRLITERANYLVQTKGTRSFPWRIIVISKNDADLANNDMVQKLSEPTKIKDISWIKPGKVAWDWWNDWNIYNIDFKAGINTQTYKYYIDFASKNKVEYVVLDEGWSLEDDIMKHNPNVDLEALIAYGKERNVGIILWSSWMALTKNTLGIFKNYANLGIKGFKVDFLDRDDAKMVKSVYDIAQKAADSKLLLDFHSMYKPTGIQRTFPNILNFEGVKGLENNKWTPNDDVPLYDCSIPFIRMMAGPMDYTPGAMRNATKSEFKPSHSNPESQGTRCHQLALYTIFEAPLQMMADSPTAYIKEQESTDFIAKIPTTFDETVALDGEVGKFVTIARKKANIWYLGAITNWDSREITIDFSFLEKGKKFEAEIFSDGINADKAAVDYKREKIAVDSTTKLKYRLASGGGLAMIIK